jgi:hypothetical protein
MGIPIVSLSLLLVIEKKDLPNGKPFSSDFSNYMASPPA